MRNYLLKNGVDNGIISILKSKAYTGGGACPGEEIDSWGIGLTLNEACDKVSKYLRTLLIPIVCRSEKGMLIFDMITVFDDEIDYVGDGIVKSLKNAGLLN